MGKFFIRRRAHAEPRIQPNLPTLRLAYLFRGTSGPIPKFAITRGTFRCELRNQRTTSNSMISSAVLNLKFLNELAASNDRNFKCTALGREEADVR